MTLTKEDFQEPHGFSVDEVNQILKNQEKAKKWNSKSKCLICDEEFIRKKFLVRHLNLHSKLQMINVLSKWIVMTGSGFP